MTVVEILMLTVIGAMAGVVGGMFGIGGGVVMIPAMQLLLGDRFGVGSLHVYKQAALAAAIVLSVPAAIRHLRSGAVAKRFVPGIVALGVFGVVAGVALAALFAREQTIHLRRLFGVCMIAIVAWSVWQQRRVAIGASSDATCPTPLRWMPVGGLIGLPAGFASGLLGIGGGVWAGPALHIFFGLRLQSAIATSSCMIAALAPVAALAQSLSVARMEDLHGASGWQLAACLTPGALIGGWLGATLTHRLRTPALRLGFNVFLVLVGARLIFS